MYKWRGNGNGSQDEFSFGSFVVELLRNDGVGSVLHCACRPGESWETVFLGKVQSFGVVYFRTSIIFLLVRNK